MFLHLEVVQGKPTQWNATPGEAKKKRERPKLIDGVPPRPAVGILRVTKLPLLEWQWGEFEHAQSEIGF